MPLKQLQNRYPRPSLEIEYDQKALTQDGCCRFVEVVVRLCGVPTAQHVRLTVLFSRTKKEEPNQAHEEPPSPQGKDIHDDYELNPTRSYLVPTEYPNYSEYHVHLLARRHERETGTLHIAMTSPAGSILSEAEYRFDSRFDVPQTRECIGFSRVRLRPSLRTSEERNALHGHFDVSSDSLHTNEHETLISTGVYPASLFPLESLTQKEEHHQ